MIGSSHPAYAIASVCLLAVEVLIALFVDDGLVRPYIGDVLAMMLVFTALRAAFGLTVKQAIGASLVIAVAVEVSQLVGLLQLLRLEDNGFARVVLGVSFEWLDLVAYAAGAAVVASIEWLRSSFRH